MNRIKTFIMTQLKEIWRIFISMLRSVVVIFIICFFIWLFGGRPDPYNSIQKIVTDLVVIKLQPRSELYTQFAHEYGLGKYGESAVIPNGKILTIDKLEKPIWIGIQNNDTASLKNILFKIYFPKDVIPVNEQEWIKGWRQFDTNLGKGFFAQFKDNIQPERGAHFDPPIQIKFPGPGDYSIYYIYFCDDFSSKKGYFIIRVVK